MGQEGYVQTDLPMSSVPTGLFGAIAAPSMYLRRHAERGRDHGYSSTAEKLGTLHHGTHTGCLYSVIRASLAGWLTGLAAQWSLLHCTVP
jgi:hypothetical protein